MRTSAAIVSIGTLGLLIAAAAGATANSGDPWDVLTVGGHDQPRTTTTTTRTVHPTRVVRSTDETHRTVTVTGAARTVTAEDVTTTGAPVTVTAPQETVTAPPATVTQAGVTVTIPGPPPVTVTPTSTVMPTVAQWDVTWPDGTHQVVRLTHP